MGVSVFFARSGVVPNGAMWASPPTLKKHVFFVGADALIGPDADGMGVSVFSARSGDIPGGAMWASPSTETRKPSLGQVTVSQLLKNSAQTARAAFFYCWSTSNL